MPEADPPLAENRPFRSGFLPCRQAGSPPAAARTVRTILRMLHSDLLIGDCG